ncbi:hypothetical protein HKB22_02065 [Vibrio parahaemolyticus]|nr:hypothetical protein [Vibrio parahaemolyticus]
MTKINSGMALTVKVNADRNRAISHAQRLVVSEPIKHRLRVFNDHKVAAIFHDVGAKPVLIADAMPKR